jgi:hypothetical protein
LPVRYQALAEFQETRLLSRLPSDLRIVRNGFPRFDGSNDADPGDQVVIAMEWIQGPTLLQGIDRAARTGNVAVVRALSAAFVQMWNELQGSGFTHGDYTAQNLLVRSNGQVACVDLDTASWNDAPLGPSGEGTPAYRHPTLFRDAAMRDAFAALVIVTSLAALADDPGLRTRHGDAASAIDGALLFSPWDLADPSTSSAFADALAGATPAVRDLVEALAEACVGNAQYISDALALIPRLKSKSITGESLPPNPAGWDVGPVVARMRAHYSDTWDDPPGPRELTNTNTARSIVPPNEPAPPEWETWKTNDIHQDEVVTADDVAELEAALARNDEAEVTRLWSQIGHDPLAALLAGEVESHVAAGYDRRVIAESRRKKDAAVIAIDAEARSRRIPLGPQARAVVRQAQERSQVQQELDEALATGDRQRLADLAVSGRLVVLGDADRRSLQRVLQAIEWPALQRAIQSDDDVLIVAAFDDELFEELDITDNEMRDRVALARRRLEWLAQARKALAKRNSTRLRELLIDPPEGAPERLSSPERRRIRLAIERQQALLGLKEVIASSDDQAIISALNRVERVGARISDRATWAQIQRVVERVAIIDELLVASEAQPLDHARLAQLIPAVKALGLERDPRLGDIHLVERLEQHVVKMAHVRRIQAAIARDNDVAIVAVAVPDPRNALEMLSEPERNRVAAAIRARRSAARAHHAQ